MHQKISVVVNTRNEEANIERVIKSCAWADEILVCDMYSEDKTAQIAKKLGAKVIFCKRYDYVEPVRNFAISKTVNPWVLILDADEEIGEQLSTRLREIAQKMKSIDYVRVPRKNIIFGKWMKASGWWPDLNVRFFRRGKVTWTDKIHRPPKVLGEGLDLLADERFAIIHHHYDSVSQFIERMIRYTTIQANELRKDGYKFEWEDLIKKPLGEFLSRFFTNRGFEDGLHGLSLSLLQAFSHLVLYLRLWEMEGFKEEKIEPGELKQNYQQSTDEINYWFKQGNLSKNPFKIFIQKIGNKI